MHILVYLYHVYPPPRKPFFLSLFFPIFWIDHYGDLASVCEDHLEWTCLSPCGVFAIRQYTNDSFLPLFSVHCLGTPWNAWWGAALTCWRLPRHGDLMSAADWMADSCICATLIGREGSDLATHTAVPTIKEHDADALTSWRHVVIASLGNTQFSLYPIQGEENDGHWYSPINGCLRPFPVLERN